MKDVSINISGWNDMDNKPNPNQVIEVDFGEKGVRKVKYCPTGTFMYYQAMDCTHPQQNINLNGWEQYATKWRPFIENRIEVEDIEYEIVEQKQIN